MKICMVAYAFYETDNRIRRYAEALVKRGDQVCAIALRKPGQISFEVIRGVWVYRIQYRSRNESSPVTYLLRMLLFFFRSAWLLTQQQFRTSYDVIHVHSVPDFEVFAALIPRLMGAQVILDIHDIVPEFYASKFSVGDRSLTFRLLCLTEKLSTAFADHVIISNHLWYEKLIGRSVQPQKCTPIINYPDQSLFCRPPRPVDMSGDFILCYPGTLNWHQGVEVAVRGVALLRDALPTIKLLIVGDGPERGKLERLVQELGLQERVTITGSVPLERVAGIMATVHLGVVPKRNDSFGNEAFSTKILEFMAMGIPVVASRTRIDQYYFDGDLVQFFEPNCADDFAAQVLRLATDSQQYDRLRSNGIAFIEHNNWDVRKSEYFDVIDRLTTHRKASRRKNTVSDPQSAKDCVVGLKGE